MATKSRAQAGAGSRKGKGARPGRGRRDQDVPLLPIVVGSILAVLLIAMIVWIWYLGRPQPSQTPTVAGVPCDHLEQTQVHYHAGLQIMYNGQVTDLPANAGIQMDSSGNATCYYWLHVHANSTNIIHIESPANNTFTLGQFFAVWNQWSIANGQGARKLSSTQVASFKLQPGQKIVTYVDLGDGKGPQIYSGDPSAILLRSHEVITIEISPPTVSPPPTLTFPSGL